MFIITVGIFKESRVSFPNFKPFSRVYIHEETPKNVPSFALADGDGFSARSYS
jgi:hypothetical protein